MTGRPAEAAHWKPATPMPSPQTTRRELPRRPQPAPAPCAWPRSTRPVHQAARAVVCAISADGEQVLMRSASSNLVPGESNFQDDLFLKNLATRAVTQVNTNATGVTIVNRTERLCHGMSHDGTWVAFTASTGGSWLYQPGPELEATLMLRNTRTGELLSARRAPACPTSRSSLSARSRPTARAWPSSPSPPPPIWAPTTSWPTARPG